MLEHLFTRLWHWNIIRNVWMGSARDLHQHVRVFLHLTRFCIRRQTRYQPYGGALSAVRARCGGSATIWASSRTGDPYFVILGGIIVAPSVGFDASSTLGIWHFWIFTHFHPFPPLFTLFCSSPPWTPTLWCGPLSWGDGLPGFCLTTVECPMRGRITVDKDAWLYHKLKIEVDVDSLLPATLPPGPVEDEVDTYEALALAGRVSELSNAATPKHSDFVFS